MRIRRHAYDWVVRPWLLWVAIATVLVFVAHANASTDQAKLNEMASRVAGRPVQVVCTFDSTEWQNQLPGMNAANVYGYWRNTRPDDVNLGPEACRDFQLDTKVELGFALNILAHESAHAGGIRDEATAACWGLLWNYTLAHDYYGIEYYSAEGRQVELGSMMTHQRLLPQYRAVCNGGPFFLG